MWSATTFRATPEGIPFNKFNSEDIAGLSSCDIRYDRGTSTLPDGSRRDIPSVHRHPHLEIFWFREGSGTMAWDCDRLEVGPRTLLVVAPGEVHSWIRTKGLEGSVLSVSETFTRQANFFLPFSRLTVLLGPKSTRRLTLNATDDTLIRSFFANLQAPGETSHVERREMAKALLLILLSRIRTPRSRLVLEQRTGAGSAIAREFLRALQTECPRLVSVKEFAELLQVSRSHLHREVIRCTGRSPNELIGERIIVEAKRLLAHTRRAPAEIARTLGFRSAAYFNCYFRARTNQSPAAFQSRRSA